MKTINSIFLILVMFFLLTDNCLGAWVEVVIDPGHGGPGASKYNNNGGGYNQGKGALGPVKKLTEQWVNLQVAFALRDSIVSYFSGDPAYVKMTRYHETSNPTYWDRANIANYADPVYGPANEFISVHHNGLPLGVKGTEVWWSSVDFTDSNYSRDSEDSLLAWKIQERLVKKWHYRDRCSYPRVPNHPCTEYCCDDCCYYHQFGDYWICCWQDSVIFVLRNTTMRSALTEASNL